MECIIQTINNNLQQCTHSKKILKDDMIQLAIVQISERLGVYAIQTQCIN